MTDRNRPLSASMTVSRSAVLQARLAELYEAVHETVQTSHELCDIARGAQDRARRTTSRGR